MGIVFKPEPLPPGFHDMSREEKMAGYLRVRGDAVATMNRQQGTANFGLAVLIAIAILAVMLALGCAHF